MNLFKVHNDSVVENIWNQDEEKRQRYLWFWIIKLSIFNPVHLTVNKGTYWTLNIRFFSVVNKIDVDKNY